MKNSKRTSLFKHIKRWIHEYQIWKESWPARKLTRLMSLSSNNPSMSCLESSKSRS